MPTSALSWIETALLLSKLLQVLALDQELALVQRYGVKELLAAQGCSSLPLGSALKALLKAQALIKAFELLSRPLGRTAL